METGMNKGGCFVHPMVATQNRVLATQDWLAMKVQEGDAFITQNFDDAGANTTPVLFRLTTPNTARYAHLLIETMTLTAGLIELYEKPTESDVPAAGDAMTVLNMNRNSSTANTMLAKSDPTFKADGTLVWFGRTQAAGSPMSNRVPIALKTNTTYQVKFTSDANSNHLWIQFIWVEHTDLV